MTKAKKVAVGRPAKNGSKDALKGLVIKSGDRAGILGCWY